MEQAKGLLKFKDKDGNIYALYPVTQRDMVEGLGVMEQGITAAAAAAAAAQTTADGAQATASAAMPKSGGIFTGEVTAHSANRTAGTLRNIEVRTVSTDGELQSTNKIILVRK